jgi:hypothetical protein
LLERYTLSLASKGYSFSRKATMFRTFTMPNLRVQHAKKWLIDNGGEVIQMMRGRLSTIHRVLEDKQTDDRIFGPIMQWFSSHPSGSPYPPEIARLCS